MKKKSLVLNFFMNFFLTLSTVLFPLITFPYVSRILGPEGTGAVAMGTSLVSYFTMIAMLGIPTYGIRACARVRENKEELSQTVKELMIINFVMSIVAYFTFYMVLILVPSFRSERTLYAICSIAIILNVIGVNWVYQALEDYTYITVVSVAFKLIGLVMMFLFVHNIEDVNWYGAITVISSFGASILNFFRLRKIIDLSTHKRYRLKRHLRPIMMFFAMTVATTIYTNLDTVMLGVMKNNEAVGYYNAAIKIKTVLATLVSSLGTVLLPRLSFYYEKGEKEPFYNLVSKAFSFVLLVSIPCCIYFSVYAKSVIDFLSGLSYLPAVPCMIIIMPTIIFIGLSNITGIQILVPMGKEHLVLRSVVAGAILDFGINLLLIPSLGPEGAALGTLLAEILVILIQTFYLRDLLLKIIKNIEFKSLFFGLLLGVGSLLGLSSLNFNGIFITLLVTSVSFFGIYGIGLIVSKEEIIWSLILKIKFINK